MLRIFYREINYLFHLSSRKARRSLTSSIEMKIGTHDGVFHCDEVMACSMLKLLPEYKDAEIVRSRDKKILDTCDIVVDVGATFNHNTKRYDHHQQEFKETLSSLSPQIGDKYTIKLSSAGLIYNYYGKNVIQALCPPNMTLSPEDVGLIFRRTYESLIQEIDAIDNGIPATEEKPKYNINTHLSSRVGKLNPEWNTEGKIDINEQFQKALGLVTVELTEAIKYFITTWLPARNLVRKAIENRFKVHESGQIVEFTERFPWKDHLFDLEADMNLCEKEKQILYVIFNDKPDSWRVQGVPQEPKSFKLRKALVKSWRGVRDEDLSKVAGIDNCIFCHSSGFIGGNKTREGAIQMAIKSLLSREPEEENGEQQVKKLKTVA